ncbi:DUF1302 family protein [Halalkalibaculum sp. DA384]|uniref:DUF1302 family protein n=1 Tax=Halalkalibaculum sp. DA384 TaxID=3373606 RepID=UPI003754F6FA
MKLYPRLFTVLFSFGIFYLFGFPSESYAQTKFTGFIRNYNAVQTVPDHNILVGRNRFRLNLRHSLSAGQIVVSNDVQNYYHRSVDSLSYRLREAYVELFFKKSDLRLGRQIIAWGRTDGAFVTDLVSPADLSEFLTRSFSDIRTGVDALTYYRYFGSDYLQLVVNPVFSPNKTPEPGDRWFARTFFDGDLPVQFQQFRREPALKNAQAAGRLAMRSNLHYDLDLGILYWHYPNPGYYKTFQAEPGTHGNLHLQEHFTQSLVFFYSGVVQLGNRLLFKSESSFYTHRSFDYLPEDLQEINYENPSPGEQLRLKEAFSRNDDGFLADQPWLIGMAGLEYETGGWTIGTQVISEFIFGHDDELLQKQHYRYATLLLQRSFLRDKLEFRGFGRYNIDGRDFWVNPEITYSGIDSFEASLGTHLFGGPEPEPFYGHLSFENYSSNSFGYLQVTAYF